MAAFWQRLAKFNDTHVVWGKGCKMPLPSFPLKTHRSAEGHQQNDCSSCCSPRACWVRAHTSTWRALIPDQTLATKGVSRSSGTDVMTWWCVWPAHRAAKPGLFDARQARQHAHWAM